jgi:hypothetical protein
VESETETLVRVLESADGAMPSANSVAAGVLIQVAQLTGRSDYLAAASRLLSGLGGRVSEAPTAHTALLQVVDRLEGDSLQIVIVGETRDPAVLEMLELVRGQFLPRVSLMLKPTENADVCRQLARLAPFTEGMAAGGAGTAYICRGHTCENPIVGPIALKKALDQVMAHRVAV